MCDQRLRWWIVLSLSVVAVGACSKSDREGSSSPAASTSTPKVYVVNYPLMYFAERIGGDRVDVVFPAPADEDPAYWRPEPDVVAAYQNADLILLNGAKYAKWVERVTLPKSKRVDTSKRFQDRYIQMADAVEHAHGPKGQHAHEGVAFTTWLDPTLADLQALAIRDALSKLLPNHTATFEQNYEALKKDLTALDGELDKLTKNAKQPLLASHPVYQYFARRYDLDLASLHWEPDEVPNEKQWIELDELRQTHPAKWMIWEADPDAETVDELRSRGIDCIVVYPCGHVPPGGDYLQVMHSNVARLKTIFHNE